jgi:S-adenosylmethionine:tRNA ribosyltransferase-isomerase
VLHIAGPAPARPDLVVVELRTLAGDRVRDAVSGERILLPRGVVATLLAAHPDPAAASSRLRRARIPVEGGLLPWLRIVGRPIRYPYVAGRWPLAAYRTIFARSDGAFGSAEMPSAGRPFSPAVLAGLRARDIGLAEVVLHTGVSSLEAGETPLPERFRVPPATAAAVNATRARGGRVVAVGTTVTRALETVAGPDGTVRAGSGWTDLVLGPDRPARTVTGLVTGWHEPQASHLLLLEAVAGRRLVRRAYAAALEQRYLWHEFGDSCLLLPSPR